MLTQLLIAYAAGMIDTIGMEVAKVIKARTLNRRALQQGTLAPLRAPSFDSAPRTDHASEPAANETAVVRPAALMRAAG